MCEAGGVVGGKEWVEVRVGGVRVGGVRVDGASESGRGNK